MGCCHWRGRPGATVRTLLAVDQQHLCAIPWLRRGIGCGRRIQRQVHAEPICTARVFDCHAGWTCAGDLPEFLSGAGTVAVHWVEADEVADFAGNMAPT